MNKKNNLKKNVSIENGFLLTFLLKDKEGMALERLKVTQLAEKGMLQEMLFFFPHAVGAGVLTNAVDGHVAVAIAFDSSKDCVSVLPKVKVVQTIEREYDVQLKVHPPQEFLTCDSHFNAG